MSCKSFFKMGKILYKIQQEFRLFLEIYHFPCFLLLILFMMYQSVLLVFDFGLKRFWGLIFVIGDLVLFDKFLVFCINFYRIF